MVGKITVTVVVFFALCISRVDGVSIDWVTVGDPGNTADTEVMSDGTTGYGKVDYAYKIGKYEVTNSQYCEFLTAVAKTDTYGLYNANMASSAYGGIIQSGSVNYYSYTVKAGFANKPVTWIGWFDSLRFANWLNNGQPAGLQNAATTESGAYTFTGATSVGTRNANAKIVLTSENEWYKAAYYKGGNLNAGYWNYATQTDICPTGQLPSGSSNSANYATSTLTDVGAYPLSKSGYGTFDQNGNAYEWNETKLQTDQWCVRGGSFGNDAWGLQSLARERNSTLYPESWSWGFRVAAVPEPATAVLFWLGALALRRWKLKS